MKMRFSKEDFYNCKFTKLYLNQMTNDQICPFSVSSSNQIEKNIKLL